MSTTSTGTRGSKLSRAVSFFREAPHDEARVAFQLVQEAMHARAHEGKAARSSPTPTRSRASRAKPKPKPAPTPAPTPQEPEAQHSMSAA